MHICFPFPRRGFFSASPRSRAGVLAGRDGAGCCACHPRREGGSGLQALAPTEQSPRGRGARSRLSAPGLRSSISTPASRSSLSPPPSARPNITPRRPAGAGPGRKPRGVGSEVAQVAAAPEQARTRRGPRGGAAAGCLFWVRSAPPSAARQWEARARQRCARARASVRVRESARPGGAPAPWSSRKRFGQVGTAGGHL